MLAIILLNAEARSWVIAESTGGEGVMICYCIVKKLLKRHWPLSIVGL
jgi:hypothetical protein